MSTEKRPTLFGIPIVEVDGMETPAIQFATPRFVDMQPIPSWEQSITIPLLAFNAENFEAAFRPHRVPIEIRFGPGRRKSSPHPTRRQRRLCARTGHPKAQLHPLFRGTVGSFTPSRDGTDMAGHVTGGVTVCNRCGAELPLSHTP